MGALLSQRIVDFIGGLHPLYVHEQVAGVWCARCLQDGTIIRATVQDDDDENGQVEIVWQGVFSNTSISRGAYVASLAIARWAELLTIAEHPKHLAAKVIKDMSHHFTIKTGETVVFIALDKDDELYELIASMLSKLGKEALVQLLRAKLGI